MDPIYGLILAIMVLCVVVAMLVASHHDTSRRYQNAMSENLQLHMTNNRLSWDNEILQSEIKHISIEYNIPSLPCGAPSRRKHHG